VAPLLAHAQALKPGRLRVATLADMFKETLNKSPMRSAAHDTRALWMK